MSNIHPPADADHQPVPRDSPHSGQPPDRVPLLHPLHGCGRSFVRPVRLLGIRVQVHGQSYNFPSGLTPIENIYNLISFSS